MEEWKEYRLGDCLEALIDYRGKTPKKTSFGIPLITAKIIKNGQIEPPTEYIAEKDYDLWMVRGLPKEGDVVLTTEAPLGEVAQLGNQKIALAQRVVTMRGKKGFLNNTYLKYFFLSNEGQGRLRARETGTTVTGIKQSELREVKITCPSYEIQKKIANILSSLDDKIEVNRKINSNLEEQAKAIFQSWKKRIKELPHSSINLSEVARFIGGYSYKGNELQPSSQAMATIKNFERKGGFKVDGYKEIIPSEKIKQEQYAKVYDILVAHTDLTQNADVIGNAEMILSKGSHNRILFSMDLVKVEPKQNFPYRYFLIALLQDNAFKSHCLGYVNGTTVLHLSKKALPDFVFDIPTDRKLIEQINLLLSYYYQKRAEIMTESSDLASLRNVLLPRLMSGELVVR